eukprot:m.7517 g.7517  ORF g.7517 m.7517 type:complete len:142 (+) comp3726_c0_seq2:654-1079(+)
MGSGCTLYWGGLCKFGFVSISRTYCCWRRSTTMIFLSMMTIFDFCFQVLNRKCLYPKIRKYVQNTINGYLQVDQILKNIDEYIVPGVHGGDAGLVGALALAEHALTSTEKPTTPSPKTSSSTFPAWPLFATFLCVVLATKC